MNRSRIALLAAAAALFVLAVSLRVQPAGTARVIRRGDSLRAVMGRAGVALPFGASCIAPRAASALAFRQTFDVTDAGGETIPSEVYFEYDLPQSVPSSLPEGTWCAAISSLVQRDLERVVVAVPIERLRLQPRQSGAAIADALGGALSSAGIAPRKLTVRPRVPQGARATLPVPEIASLATKEPPLIVIGLDGADWELLDRYIASGAMPNLGALVATGTSDVLMTEHPPLSPLLWTTMMTGTSPLEHEILDFARFHPVSGAKEPITSSERQRPAIWNMATAGGKSAAVFGLWATWPAEPVRGLLVSDRFFSFLFSESEPPPQSVYPPSRQPWAKSALDAVEEEVGHAQVARFLPWLQQSEYESLLQSQSRNPYDHPVTALRRILIETGVYQRLAREALREKTPDLTILYLQGTDSIGHVFAPFMPPRQPEVEQSEFDRYSAVPELFFRHVDGIIGEFAGVARARGARLMIVSDHGFHWYEGRPTQISSFAAASAAKWHRKEGIALLWGPGIPASRRRTTEGAPEIAQVCATLLALTGLPRAEGIAGPAIAARESAHAVDYDARYEPIATPAYSDPKAASEEIAKLKALGYIGSNEATSRPAAAGRSTHTASWYNNRGLILKDRGKEEEAIAALNEAISLDPNLPSAQWNLSDLLFAKRRDLDRSDQLLVGAFANGLPEANKFLIGRAIGYQRSGSIERSVRLLEAAVKAKPDDPELRLFRGRYLVERQDCAGALADFETAERLQPRNPVTYASSGLALLCLGRQPEAAMKFRRSLELDPNQPRLRAMLGIR